MIGEMVGDFMEMHDRFGTPVLVDPSAVIMVRVACEEGCVEIVMSNNVCFWAKGGMFSLGKAISDGRKTEKP